jgi:hypothetical protein
MLADVGREKSIGRTLALVLLKPEGQEETGGVIHRWPQMEKAKRKD